MFDWFRQRNPKDYSSECPYEIEMQEQPRVIWHNCRGCRWNRGLCLAPETPRLFASRSGRLMLCLDRAPWGDMVLRQAEQVAREAWNAPRSQM